MKLRSSARVLKGKSISSIRTSVAAFNSLNDDGRTTTVLLHLQHAFEMLLKAALNQERVILFDKKTGRSVGIDSVINRAQSSSKVRLTDEEAGTIRTIDAMRDDEQHWYNTVDEGILYLHARASITLFDDLLQRVFGDRLASHLPTRVLPISVEPPQDFQLLVDREYEIVARLLSPGRRAGAEARARIRTLLAMEAHVEPDTRVSDADVSRVEAGIREGKPRDQVFPKLSGVGASVAGKGIEVTVRFVKQGGLPVTFVKDGSRIDAAAVRTVDLQKKFHWSAGELAAKLSITTSKAVALRRHLGVDSSEDMMHEFAFGSTRVVRYSDNAFTVMREALDKLDMDAIWASHAPTSTKATKPMCTQVGCVIQLNLAA
jgi:hypothetical protein